MLHSNDPLPSRVEEMMGRGGRRGVPRDPLEKMMAVGYGAEDGDEGKQKAKRDA